jgi:hypothetical protein
LRRRIGIVNPVKLMYVVRGDAGWLLDPALRERLAAGAHRLQVNVDDAHVADAQLRLSTYDAPVTGVVSVWTDDDPTETTRRLGARAGQIAGWVVEERTPLPPPPTPVGQRADALANIALLRIPHGMDREVWLDRWLNHHTQVAIDTQATFGYVQNVVVAELTPGEPRVDALVEELFPMAATTDLHAFYGSDGDETELARRMTLMLGSVATFGAHENIDVIPTSRYELL